MPSFLSRLFSARRAAAAAPAPAPAPARASAQSPANTLGLRALAHLRKLGWSDLIDELVQTAGRARAGEEVLLRLSEKEIEIGAGAALARPVTLAMFACEAAATFANAFKLPPSDVAALAQDILQTDLGRNLGQDAGELMAAHASTVEQLFPEGFNGGIEMHPDQMEFAWGVLLGNWTMTEFLRAVQAGDAKPTPSQSLAERFAQVMTGEGELPMPVAGELALLPR